MDDTYFRIDNPQHHLQPLQTLEHVRFQVRRDRRADAEGQEAGAFAQVGGVDVHEELVEEGGLVGGADPLCHRQVS